MKKEVTTKHQEGFTNILLYIHGELSTEEEILILNKIKTSYDLKMAIAAQRNYRDRHNFMSAKEHAEYMIDISDNKENILMSLDLGRLHIFDR